jgi:hypothetical protein
MTDSKTIPPPELVLKWASEWLLDPTCSRDNFMTTKAAQYAADQELDACCEVLDNLNDGYWSYQLRVARRPKPLSLKRQALDALYAITAGADDAREFFQDVETIREALEQLND